MILLSMILPAALVCLVLLYGNLLRRFFRIRAELPVLGLRDGLGQLTGKKKRLAALGALRFFLLSAFWASWGRSFGPLIC